MASHGPGRHESGFTLVEMIVALALLALISLAGLALVNSVIAARTRSEHRLDRLADLQRAITIIDADLTQVTPGPIGYGAGGLSFSRASGGATGSQKIEYLFYDNGLERIVDGRTQHLLGGIAAARLTFYAAGIGWLPRWPPEPRLRDRWPAAVAIDVTLANQPGLPTGTIRRVIELPSKP